MLAPENFFDLDNWAHPALFAKDEPVWQTLARLKSYVAEALYPNAQKLGQHGPMLQETLVLYQGELLSTGFDLIPGDATKGKFQVLQEGEVERVGSAATRSPAASTVWAPSSS